MFSQLLKLEAKVARGDYARYSAVLSIADQHITVLYDGGYGVKECSVTIQRPVRLHGSVETLEGLPPIA